MPEPKIFTPKNRLDSGNATAFEQEIMGQLGTDAPRVLIDFSDLNYISSAGLRVVLLTAKKTKAAGGKLVLCGLSESINEVFMVSGFNAILDIQPTREAALARLQ